jgi:LysM repeat protein
MDYEVKPGDTLASIADKFFTDAETVRRLNYILGDDIRVGQRLVVPKLEPTPLPTAEPFTYTVEAGDSLGALALKFNVDAKEIMRANDISDPNALRVGQNIVIPGYSVSISAAPQAAEGGNAGEATGAGGDEVVHVVQPGEGLFEIAALYGVNASAIAQANGVNTPNLLRAGQKLIIPGITQSEARRARSTIHVVQSGETLISIAQRYGVSAEAIAAENELANPNALRVGQELMIPNQ